MNDFSLHKYIILLQLCIQVEGKVRPPAADSVIISSCLLHTELTRCTLYRSHLYFYLIIYRSNFQCTLFFFNYVCFSSKIYNEIHPWIKGSTVAAMCRLYVSMTIIECDCMYTQTSAYRGVDKTGWEYQMTSPAAAAGWPLGGGGGAPLLENG